jgi:hypothetical protein
MRARSIAWICSLLITLTAPAVSADDQPPTLKDMLARVGDYVVRYERDLSGIVAEEHYIQDENDSFRPPRRHRELRSDLLLVRASGSDGYVQFRDVFDVDGRPVRDRSERLLKLFLDPSAANTRQAGQIITESSRYNVGRIERNINVPLLALMFMHPRNQSRFKFTMSPESRGVPKSLPKSDHFTVSVDVLVLTFRETTSPTFVRDPSTSRGEARSHGRVWVEPETGRILMTELIVESRLVRSSTQVSYQSEPLVGFLVPVEMREDYVMSRQPYYRIAGTATYGNFRQFTVKTDETIRPGGIAKDSR